MKDICIKLLLDLSFFLNFSHQQKTADIKKKLKEAEEKVCISINRRELEIQHKCINQTYIN